MPYKFGIDSMKLAGGQVINQAQLDAIDFHICRMGTHGFGGMGTSSWYDRGFSVDAYCLRNIQATQAAGKPMGLYLFSYAWDAQSAEREADEAADVLDGWGVNLELPIFLDWESTGRPPGNGSYEKFQDMLGYTPTAAEVMTIFESYCSRLSARGYRPGWYCNGWFYGNLFTAAWAENMRTNGRPWWLAQWQNTPDPPYPCDVWQYAGDQTWIDGLGVDYNYLINENIIVGGSNISIWLMMKMAKRGDKNACTILL